MPKMKLETLEAKQKIYLKLIVDLQKDLDKITNSIKSAKSKPVAAKKEKAPAKKAPKRAAAAKPAKAKKVAVKKGGRKPKAAAPAK